jgi:hypothetical protein
VQQTRAEIAGAARRLFVGRGWAATTVRNVAREAGRAESELAALYDASRRRAIRPEARCSHPGWSAHSGLAWTFPLPSTSTPPSATSTCLPRSGSNVPGHPDRVVLGRDPRSRAAESGRDGTRPVDPVPGGALALAPSASCWRRVAYRSRGRLPVSRCTGFRGPYSATPR